MSSSPNQRTKLLYLKKILLEKTDEQNPITMQGIITELAEHDIHAERKSIYNDMDILRQYGLDIEIVKGKIRGYYIAYRQFELPELKLLVDAVQSSRFITEKKSEELIAKLSSLTSQAQAADLKRHIVVANRPKSINEQSYYSVDVIHAAVNNGKKIAFKYFDYDVNKNRVFRKDGADYKVTPVTLCWDSDKYYLVAYNAEHNELRNYRVDRMCDVMATDISGDDFDKSRFNIAEYIRGMFGMYGGEVTQARISFDNSLVNVVLDYFGKDTVITPIDNERFEVSVDVTVSPVFLGWVFQFAGKAQILSPDSLVNAMREMVVKNTW
jgi:predicted DNA-binding transcriptional regulator YafY